jgi:hypothetical protein
MATTLEQIKDEFYDLVGSNSTSTVYPESWVENLANIVQGEICRAWKWSFLKKKHLFNTVIDNALNGGIATTDTTITLDDASGFDSSSSVWIDQDIVAYTGTTATTLTGVTGIDIAHSDGTKVEQLYSMPSDYSHRPTLNIFQSGQTPITYTFVDDFDFDTSDISYRWTIINDNNGNKFIRIKNPSNQQIGVFHYYKKASTMTDSVNATIPDEFALSVISRTMAGVAQVIRGDNIDNIGNLVTQIANKDIIKMKRYYGMRNTPEIQTTKLAYGSRAPRGLQAGRNAPYQT